MNPPAVPAWQLAIRFGLEVGALFAIGKWAGQTTVNGLASWSAALGVPALVALVWVTFAVRGDPSRSGGAPVPVPGWLRLAIECAVFGAGALALARLGTWRAWAVFMVALVVHHAGTLPRLRWLLSQR